ncbi:hypothetical protein GCM10020367_06480 [Streptomyces sannanensis]|uniref:Uncharacterized protein n=1 Tax=Streptomyces sannanensis TaxID=285536 RepID=A0ABP6S528_9ACTN
MTLFRVSSLPIHVECFVVVPEDRNGADGLEPDLQVVALNQANQAAAKYGRLTGLVGDDVQDDLRRGWRMCRWAAAGSWSASGAWSARSWAAGGRPSASRSQGCWSAINAAPRV